VAQTTEKADKATTRTAAIVQWPQASVFLAEGKDGGFPDTVKLNTGRAASVEGGWVTLLRGEEVPAEAAEGQVTLLLEIGAAAGVIVPA